MRSEHTAQKVCQFSTLWLNQLLAECIKNILKIKCNWVVAQCGWKRQPIIVCLCSVRLVSQKGLNWHAARVEQKLSRTLTLS